jgi:primosomal protein DnaI
MTLDEMKKVVLTDPETRHLKISDVDVYKVFIYLQERDQQTVIDGYKPVLRTDPYIEIVYEPTKEKEMEIRRNKIKKHLKFYDSEVYIQDASLARFEVFNEEREKAYRLAS